MIEADLDETRLRKIGFRAWRRGFREADLILGPFVDTHGASLSAKELDELERLLEEPDQELYAWIIGRTAPPAAFAGGILTRIQDFRFSALAARGAGARAPGG